MEKNQNDHRNQPADHKSNQHSTPDDMRKKEVTPDKPTASQGKDHGAQQGNLQHHDSAPNTGKKNTDVQNVEGKESKEHEQNPKKGNM